MKKIALLTAVMSLALLSGVRADDTKPACCAKGVPACCASKEVKGGCPSQGACAQSAKAAKAEKAKAKAAKKTEKAQAKAEAKAAKKAEKTPRQN